MTVQSVIAKLGESPAFVAAMAHCWFAFSVLAVAAHFGLTFWFAAPAAVSIAAVKEFWFDLRYETTPVQTVGDSAGDFIEYLAGIALAVLIFH